MDKQELINEYEEIMQELKERVERALQIVQEVEPSEYDRARLYWYSHIITNIDDEHPFVCRNTCTMRYSFGVMMDGMHVQNNERVAD